MPQDARKAWISTEVGELLDAALVLAKIAHERASVKPPGRQRAVMPADYRTALKRLESNIRETRHRLAGMVAND